MAEFTKRLLDVGRIPDVKKTVALAEDDPPAASREMYEAYRKLSEALGWFLHGNQAPENATFPTFAAWTLRSLRREVEGDDQPKIAGDMAADGHGRRPRRRPARRFYDTFVERSLPDSQVIGRNIASGQAAIYEEVAPALLALLEVPLRALTAKARPDWDQVWKDYTDKLVQNSREVVRARKGGRASLEPGDVPHLQLAFAPYFDVLRRDVTAGQDLRARKVRAQLILLGNIRLVAYEQKRLQPVLERNLNYVPHALRLKLVNRWSGRETPVTSRVIGAYRYIDRVVSMADEAYQIAATRYVYSMLVGQEELRFGVDVPLPPPAHPLLRDDQVEEDRKRYTDGDFFPVALQVIDEPDLWATWQQYDRSVGQGVRTAVDNWLRYPERLNFIVNVFRSRQQLTDLYDRPVSIAAPIPGPPPPVLGRAAGELSKETEERLRRIVTGESDAQAAAK